MAVWGFHKPKLWTIPRPSSESQVVVDIHILAAQGRLGKWSGRHRPDRFVCRLVSTSSSVSECIHTPRKLWVVSRVSSDPEECMMALSCNLRAGLRGIASMLLNSQDAVFPCLSSSHTLFASHMLRVCVFFSILFSHWASNSILSVMTSQT